MPNQTSKSDMRRKHEKGALPQLRGMFICPEPIKNCTDDSSGFSLTDFFDNQQADTNMKWFHKMLHQHRRSESVSGVTGGLMV